MRIISILTFVCLGNAAAGSLFFAAFLQGTLGITLGVIGLSVVLAASVSGWGCLKLRRSISSLSKQNELTPEEDQTTGIVELDEIGRRFIGLIREAKEKSSSELAELEEMKRLLEKIDRRDDAYDSESISVDCVTHFRGILKGCAGELDSNIRQAVSCGREIHQAAQEIVIGSETQSDSVDQTTSYIEQLSTRILNVCDNAEEAIEFSTRAKSTASSGLAKFQELVEEMKQIRNHAAARERKLQALGQHTKEIEAIVQTIGTLSSRTDLLALNASIESVRAGAHGRGFAVVAEEVRALAEQSAQAVQDITRRIELIQLETHQSISVASGEHDQMHGVIQRVTETLDSLQEICDATNQSAKGLNEISDSTNQQLQLTREIIDALERSTETTKKNRSRAEGANWTAKTLSQIGQQLESSLDLFRLAGALDSVQPASYQKPSANNSTVDVNLVSHDSTPVLS